MVFTWAPKLSSVSYLLNTCLEYTESFNAWSIVLTVCLVVITTFLFKWWRKSPSLEVSDDDSDSTEAKSPVGGRFRKRDKLLFWGRKYARKVQKLGVQIKDPEKVKRRAWLKIQKQLSKLRRSDSEPSVRMRYPPSSFFEADVFSEYQAPQEFAFLLHSLRIFGRFEEKSREPLFLELCKHTETKRISEGNYLFRIGDPDDSLFVVQDGEVAVFTADMDGKEVRMKVARAGDTIHSLLSILDVLTGHPTTHKLVSARALKTSTVIRLPVQSYREVCRNFPEVIVRMVQVIMIRLQRVTFTALHEYLGLTHELIGSGRLTLSGRRLHTDSTGQSSTPLASSSPSEKPLSVATVSSPQRIIRSAALSNDLAEDLPKMNLAKSHIVNMLGLKDPTLLDSRISFSILNTGTRVVSQEEQEGKLVYVLSGQLSATQRSVGISGEDALLFTVGPGELAGIISVLAGEPSFVNLTTDCESHVAVIMKSDFYQMMREEPEIVLNTAHIGVQRMSPFVRMIDFCVDWNHLEAAKALYRQDDVSDSVYIILTGRLRSVVAEPSGTKELIAEYGRGEIIGLVEVLTNTPRATTALAVRDTEVAKLPAETLNLIKRRYPHVVTRLIHLLGHKLLGTITRPTTESALMEPRPSVPNLNTVALVAASDDVPLGNFALELRLALSSIGNTLLLTSDEIRSTLGKTSLDPVNDYRLVGWLGQQEDAHRMVLYQTDLTLTQWTARCVRQADCILIVGLADHSPNVGKLEDQLQRVAVKAQKELILLHKDDGSKPRRTANWLNAREWVSNHHHIKCPSRVFKKKNSLKVRQHYQRLLLENRVDRMSDFSRLARFLTGTSIGLCLGGGGARGCSHVGLIKAMQEAGIPIDMVCGTSIGAFMGALWCDERNLTGFIQRARSWSMEMTSLWRKILDLTYPFSSMFSGKAFNTSIKNTFHETQIEDLWIPYFTVTTDITVSRMRVHTMGSLWRYVRASMSLSGYLPPLCDPVDGHLLLDGGYVNNLPADIMREKMGAQNIFAIDVGSEVDTDLTNYGDELSGWWILYRRWFSWLNPWARSIKVLSLAEIQSRLAYVSCMRQLAQVKKSRYCQYIRPPILKYGTLQFASFDEIMDVGYNHGKSYFDGLMHSQLMTTLFTEHSKSEQRPKLSPYGVQDLNLQQPIACITSSNTYTDLAELVSKIDETQPLMKIPSDISETDEDLDLSKPSHYSAGAEVSFCLHQSLHSDEQNDDYDEDDSTTSQHLVD